jgi:hypothetical protein
MKNRMFLRKAINLVIALVCTVYFSAMPVPRASAASTTRYVAATGTDAGTCRYPEAPCRTIQYAINNSSSGDKILVAKGTYTYNATGDQCSFLQTRAVVCFVDKSLTILGGYSTTNWSTPQPSTNLTIVDGQNTYRGVAAIGYQTTTTFLDMQGFTIQNGRAQGPTYLSPYEPGGMGGGMFVQHASVNLADVIFKNNQAIGANTPSGDGGKADGAGLRIESAPAGTTCTLKRVTFDGNQSHGGTGPDRGGVAFGALFIYQATVVVEDSAFTNNLAQAGSSNGSGTSSQDGLNADALGAGVSVENGAITLRRTNVTGNSIKGGNASTMGGGAFGAGVFVEGVGDYTSSLTMSDSYVANNSGTAGNAATGGVAGGGGINTANSLVVIERTKVIGNSAVGGSSTTGGKAGAGAGGGVYVFAIRAGVPGSTFKNLIVTDNLANQGTGVTGLGNGGGGGIIIQGMNADISHTTIARNRVGSTMVLGQALVVEPWNVVSGELPASVNFSHGVIADHTEGESRAAAVVVEKFGTITFNQGLFSGNKKNINSDNFPAAAGTINGLATMLSAGSAGFISPGSPHYNYHLRSDSPAKDQATTSTATVDIDGQSRPYGSASDLGADEYSPFTLSVAPGNGTLQLDWTVGAGILVGGVSDYQIVVTCPAGANPPQQGACGQPINAGTATQFTLTGLTNFKQYTLVVYGRDASQKQMATSTNIAASPTNLAVYIPLVVK